jgi:hypothetical protein
VGKGFEHTTRLNNEVWQHQRRDSNAILVGINNALADVESFAKREPEGPRGGPKAGSNQWKENELKPTHNNKLTHQTNINNDLTTTDVTQCSKSLDAGQPAWRDPLLGRHTVYAVEAIWV